MKTVKTVMNSQIAQATQAQNLFETTIFTDLKDA
jgi:hypothetical protein